MSHRHQSPQTISLRDLSDLDKLYPMPRRPRQSPCAPLPTPAASSMGSVSDNESSITESSDGAKIDPPTVHDGHAATPAHTAHRAPATTTTIVAKFKNPRTMGNTQTNPIVLGNSEAEDAAVFRIIGDFELISLKVKKANGGEISASVVKPAPKHAGSRRKVSGGSVESSISRAGRKVSSGVRKVSGSSAGSTVSSRVGRSAHSVAVSSGSRKVLPQPSQQPEALRQAAMAHRAADDPVDAYKITKYIAPTVETYKRDGCKYMIKQGGPHPSSLKPFRAKKYYVLTRGLEVGIFTSYTEVSDHKRCPRAGVGELLDTWDEAYRIYCKSWVAGNVLINLKME